MSCPWLFKGRTLAKNRSARILTPTYISTIFISYLDAGDTSLLGDAAMVQGDTNCPVTCFWFVFKINYGLCLFGTHSFGVL